MYSASLFPFQYFFILQFHILKFWWRTCLFWICLKNRRLTFDKQNFMLSISCVPLNSTCLHKCFNLQATRSTEEHIWGDDSSQTTEPDLGTNLKTSIMSVTPQTVTFLWTTKTQPDFLWKILLLHSHWNREQSSTRTDTKQQQQKQQEPNEESTWGSKRIQQLQLQDFLSKHVCVVLKSCKYLYFYI